MTTLNERRPGRYIKALVYGQSKVGKTFGAATFPRPCFIDCDNGIATVTSPEFIKQFGWKGDLEYESFVENGLNSRGVPQTHNAFDDVCRYFDTMMKAGNRDKFDTWVVDTGTSLSAFAMNKALVLLSGQLKGAKSDTLAEGLKTGLIAPKKQDYGSERSMVEQFIGMVYDTDKHFLFLCHDKEIWDSKGETIDGIVPLLTGRGVQAISALFDEVWNVRARKEGLKTIRYLQTQTDGVRMAGSRTGIPDGILWTYPEISKALSSNITWSQQHVTTNQARP